MILVSYCGVEHDNSISVYDNGKILYAKYERDIGVKHARPSFSWYIERLQNWGIDYRKVNSFCTNFNPPLDNGNALPYASRCNNKSMQFVIHNNKSIDYYVNHHFCHAYSNLNFNFDCSKAIVLDGYGPHNYSSWLHNPKFRQNSMYKYKSSGIILDNLGFKIGLTGDDLDFAGKIMGLQSYGQPDTKIINDWSNHFPYDNDLFDSWVRNYDIKIDYHDQKFLDFVATVFWTAYEINKKYFSHFSKDEKIIFSGGTALNVNWNRQLLDSGYKLDIQPQVHDESISLGGLRFLCDINNVPFEMSNFPYCQDDEAPNSKPNKDTIDKVAELLANGKIVGWYQGHGELGPRALGNRSILMKPDIPDGKDMINKKIKKREWWRPFGASVKKDKASEYFDLDNSPYMLYAAKVLNSDIHSITHVDGTCRHQTVTPEQNPLFYDLLDAFESKTGLPVLLNTSLNLGGKPIAGKIEEAIELFNTSEMDALCVGNDLYIK